MRFFLKTSFFFLILGSFIYGQDGSRQQKVEELKKVAAQIEQLENQIDKIGERRDELTGEILDIGSEDREEAGRIGAKAARLFPDGMMDKLIDAPDEVGFSIYSFTEIAEYYFAPRLEYKNESLKFYKETDNQENFIFIADIGKTRLDALNEQSREFAALVKYRLPTEIKDVKTEFASDNLTFKQSASVVVGNTYLVRAVGYGRGDGIFAVKVQRKDEDGSIVIFVKTIKTFEPPKSKIAASTYENQNNQEPTGIYDGAATQAVQDALQKNGFFDIVAEVTTTEVTLRGTVPKGKMAAAIQAAQESAKRKIKNELTER